MNPLNWDWALVLKAALGAGIGTAFVQGALTLFKDYRMKQDHAAYLALRLTVIFEAYSAACFDFVADNANLQTPYDEQYPTWDCELPTLRELPADVDGWRALNRNLVAKALNFANKIHGSQGAISAEIEHSMGDGLIDTLEQHACERGLEAWNIAQQMRKAYRLGKSDTIFDYESFLRTRLEAAKKEIDDRQQRQVEMIDAMSAAMSAKQNN